MKISQKRLTVKIAIFALFLIFNLGVSAKAAILTPNVQSKSAIVVDFKTGQVIASKNDQKRYPIASISKLLVIYLVEQQISDGKLKRTDVVKIPDKILHFSKNAKVANVAMSKKNKYTVDELEKAAILPSSNAAAMALAEKVSGSQTNFYQDAEKLLASWGIKNVKIYSSSGLANGDMGSLKEKSLSKDAQNQLSAREVAVVATKLLKKYPNVLNITKMTQADFPNPKGGTQKINTTIRILGHSNYDFMGLKTGTYLKGYNFVGYGKLKDQPVITVVFNKRHVSPFLSTESMLNQANLATKVVNQPVVPTTQVDNADTKAGKVTIKPQQELPIFVPNDFNPADLESTFLQKANLTAPLKRNEFVGTQSFKFKQASYNDFIEKQPKVKYVAKTNVEKTWLLVSWWRKIAN